VRRSALLTSLITLAMAVALIAHYPFPAAGTHAGAESAGPFALSNFSWLGAGSAIDIRFSVALDGLSVWLFGLSALLTFTAVLVSWDAIEERAAGFYALLLLLETACWECSSLATLFCSTSSSSSR